MTVNQDLPRPEDTVAGGGGERQRASEEGRLGVPLRGLTRRATFAVTLGVIGVLAAARPAEAALLRGIQDIVTGVLQVPISTLTGTFKGPPVIGTVVGMVGGLIRGIGLVASGAFNIAASGVALAKTAAPYVLPFVL